MSEIIFREFKEDDQEAVADLYRSGMHGYDHIPLAGPCYAWYVERRLRRDGDMSNIMSVYMQNFPDRGGFWVAEYERKIVGCIGAVPSTHEKYSAGYVELVRMIVSNDCRKMAVGSRLVTKLEAWAKSVGYTGVYCWTFQALPEANLLYPKCGYFLAEEENFDVSEKLELSQPALIVITLYTKALLN